MPGLRPFPTVPALVVLAGCLLWTLPAQAGSEPSPWRGSSLSVRSSVQALSFDPSAELTYNPSLIRKPWK